MPIELYRWTNTAQDRNFRNKTNENWAKLEGTHNEIEKVSEQAKEDSSIAKEKAVEANEISNSVQTQLDELVLAGDSSVEAAQARVDSEGNPHYTLKARLDTDFKKHAKKLAEMAIHTDGWVNIKSYGAVGDGIKDDTTAIQSALDLKVNGGCNVFIPSGIYRITAPLIMKHDNTRIVGAGTSIIKKDFVGNAFNQTSNLISYCVLKDFIVDGNNNGGHGFYGYRLSGGNTGSTSMIFENMTFKKHGDDGVHLEAGYVCRFVDGDYINNNGNGIYLKEANASTLDHVNIFGCGTGLFITGGTFSCAIISPIIQECINEGIKLGSCYAVTILNPYMEKNGVSGSPTITCNWIDGDAPTNISIFNPYITGVSNVSRHGIQLIYSNSVDIYNPRISGVKNEAIRTEQDSSLTTIYGIGSGTDRSGFISDNGSRTSLYTAPNQGLISHRPTPDKLVRGFSFFDRDFGKTINWNGTTWVDATSRPVWCPTKMYAVGDIVNTGKNQYQCTVEGTTGTQHPYHTSGTAKDGTVTWSFVKSVY